MTCPICRQFQGTTPITSRNETKIKGHRHHLVPSFPWEDLINSAESCYCCEIILKGCKETSLQRDVSPNDITDCSLRFHYPAYLETVDTDSCDKQLKFTLNNGHYFEIEIYCADDDETDIPQSWDYFPTLARTSPATDSEEAMVMINQWITDCVEGDESCETLDDSELPKRVVDVGLNDGTVKLVETEGRKEQYICLSHCWGLEQIITTTLLTIEDRKRSIEWEELSKTFQDAIVLTRKLGFRCIWIDSLCIIQDSAADWATESAKMASVYSNGYLTIAGTKSSSGRGGLFNRTPEARIAGQTPDGEEYALYFRQLIDHQLDVVLGTHGDTATEIYYPLLSRAWVYQERMLSTRLLHFGHYEIFFECKSAMACECGRITGLSPNEDEPVALIKLEYATALDGYAAGHKGRAAEKIAYYGARLWRTMVCCYTALRLTKSKDRLVAFGGLAKQMQEVRKTRYLAGLWEDSLQDDLIWTLRATNDYKAERPEPRNAPTWSWASVECASGVDYWDTIIFTDLLDGAYDDPQPREHYTTIAPCDVAKDEAAMDNFGPTGRGKIIITGLVMEGTFQREMLEKNGEKHVVDFVVLGNRRLPFASDYVLDSDAPGRVEKGSQIVCLRMSLIDQGKMESLISLVLRQVNSAPDLYERIGSMTVRGQKGIIGGEGGIYDTGEERRIVLV